MSHRLLLSVSLTATLTLFSMNAQAGLSPGGTKGDALEIDVLMVEGITHQSYVSTGWSDSVAEAEQDDRVTEGTYLLENAQRTESKGDHARAEHESFVHAERTVDSVDGCVVWNTELALDGGYDLHHAKDCEISAKLVGGPVGICSEIASFNAVAVTGWVDIFGPYTQWLGSIGGVQAVRESLTDGVAYVYEVEMAEGDSLHLSTTAIHQGHVHDPQTWLGGNNYQGYTHVEVFTPRPGVHLEAFAVRGQPGLFSVTGEDAVEYTALFTGTHRFEVVFDDRLHVSGKNFRSNRRGNVTGDYYAESLASVRFCP